MRRSAVVVAALVLTLSALVGGARPAAAAGAGAEAGFLSLTNSLRAGKGLGSLTTDDRLTAVARSWAARMAAAGDISHNARLSGQAPPEWQKVGENVGMGGTGGGNSVEAIHGAFVRSPSHYANLVDPAYSRVGIGVAYGAGGRIYVVQDFMGVAPTAAPGPDPSGPAPASSGPAPGPTADAATPQAQTPAPSPQLTLVLDRLQAFDASMA